MGLPTVLPVSFFPLDRKLVGKNDYIRYAWVRGRDQSLIEYNHNEGAWPVPVHTLWTPIFFLALHFGDVCLSPC